MIPIDPSPLDRLWKAFRALLRAELPTLSFLGSYEYVVTATDGTADAAAKTVDCKPTDPALNLPAIEKCPIRLPYGVTPPVGAICVVQFLNGDSSKGYVTNFVDPMTLMVFAAGTLPNARQGDMVAVSFSGASIVALASTLLGNLGAPILANPANIAAAAIPGAPSVPPITIYGIISSGRKQVKS
jgi:hypothetical protein